MKAHDEMVKRQKLEKNRHRAEKQVLKRLAQEEPDSRQDIPPFTQQE